MRTLKSHKDTCIRLCNTDIKRCGRANGWWVARSGDSRYHRLYRVFAPTRFRVGVSDSRAALHVVRVSWDLEPTPILRSIYAKSPGEWDAFPGLWQQYFSARPPRLAVHDVTVLSSSGLSSAPPESNPGELGYAVICLPITLIMAMN